MSHRDVRIDSEFSPNDNFSWFVQELRSLRDDEFEDEDSIVSDFVSEMERWALTALESARTFSPKGQLSTLSLFDRFIPIEEKHRARVLENPVAVAAIELALIERAPNQVVLTSERLRDFIGVVRPFAMHGATRIYLDELCELYLSGRDLAVFLLARSALDETVEGVIESRSLADDFDQWRKEARTKGVYPTMEDRLKFLKFRGLLSQYLFDQADRIRLQGNSAAHDHSKLIAMNPSAKETMRSLSAIMKELSKTSDG